MRSIHSHAAKVPDSVTNLNLDSEKNDALAGKIKTNESALVKFNHAALSPPIIIVGTHKDDLDSQELVARKFERIKELVSNKIYSQHIVEPYFALDTSGKLSEHAPDKHQDERSDLDMSPPPTSRQPPRRDETDMLKKTIELVALNEPYIGEMQPLKWMKFEKSLEKLKNKGLFYASLSQAGFKSIFLSYLFAFKICFKASYLSKLKNGTVP